MILALISLALAAFAVGFAVLLYEDKCEIKNSRDGWKSYAYKWHDFMCRYSDEAKKWKALHCSAIEQSVKNDNELVAQLVEKEKELKAQRRLHDKEIACREALLDELKGKITKLNDAAKKHDETLKQQAFIKCCKCGKFVSYAELTKHKSGFICSVCKTKLDEGEAHRAYAKGVKLYREWKYAEALKWYKKAAEQGYAEAQFKLGAMYRDGYGVAQDYLDTVKWFTLAAEQGHVVAQYCLGYMYRHGYGVDKSLPEALKWYKKASEQGDKESARWAKKIEKELEENNDLNN